MKKPINSEPPAETGGTGELNANSNSAFIVQQSSPEYKPEINWLAEREAARVRMDTAIREGNITALAIAQREYDHASSRCAGTALWGEDHWDIKGDE